MFGLGLIVYGLASFCILYRAYKKGKGWRFFARYSCLSAIVLGAALLIE